MESKLNKVHLPFAGCVLFFRFDGFVIYEKQLSMVASGLNKRKDTRQAILMACQDYIHPGFKSPHGPDEDK